MALSSARQVESQEFRNLWKSALLRASYYKGCPWGRVRTGPKMARPTSSASLIDKRNPCRRGARTSSHRRRWSSWQKKAIVGQQDMLRCRHTQNHTRRPRSAATLRPASAPCLPWRRGLHRHKKRKPTESKRSLSYIAPAPSASMRAEGVERAAFRASRDGRSRPP